MSELSNHTNEHSHQLFLLTKGFLDGEPGEELVKDHQTIINTATPLEIILAFDEIMKEDYPITEVKKAVNKVMNLLNKSISQKESPKLPPDSYLDIFIRNNAILAKKLDTIRPLIRPFNNDPTNETVKHQLLIGIRELQLFKKQYTIKENILFPIIEKHLPQHRCLRIMWSFHDDIIHNLKRLDEELMLSIPDVRKINQLLGLVFFNMLAIKFREEKVLFPVILSYVPEQELEQLMPESLELDFPYYTPEAAIPEKEEEMAIPNGMFNLDTGTLSLDQIKLIFNHLPVDITFVDEHDRVQFFSTPPKRIFPRSKAIIGRLVQNCHPHESIEVVNRIVASFKSGEKSQADFWIKMKDQMFLIQYFAVRDEQKQYRGVIEVSQEIDAIRALEGERRLLDW
ncbi:MAG: DUF438 domain-containing protein [Marinilabiliaceae bacterium]|nr:DUF438 domain-containing protein [Marinilabiliaceae bacterium]